MAIEQTVQRDIIPSFQIDENLFLFIRKVPNLYTKIQKRRNKL